jgi:cysteine dioxygenase
MTLSDLYGFLDNLKGPAPLDELAARVRRVDINWGELTPYVRFSLHGYTRNLVRSGPWYQVLVLCWTNGQRSPIHDHVGSHCVVRVLRGVLTETRFEFAANAHVKAVGSWDYPLGSVLASKDRDLHQISNLSAGMADLATLHVYSPPLLQMGTCSTMDASPRFRVAHDGVLRCRRHLSMATRFVAAQISIADYLYRGRYNESECATSPLPRSRR